MTYLYSVKDVDQQTTATSVIFYLDGNEQFDFKLIASNVLGMSTEVTYSNITEQLGKVKYCIILCKEGHMRTCYIAYKDFTP